MNKQSKQLLLHAEKLFIKAFVLGPALAEHRSSQFAGSAGGCASTFHFVVISVYFNF